jgi:DNA processing protein
LGHGHNYIYPKYHADLFKSIEENGSLISEFEPNTMPSKYNFPKRNRIIAGIANATLVVESKDKGGSLITAQIANSYNKDVFAIPGNIESKSSSGCNNLISNNEALLINSAEELIQLMELKKKKTVTKENNMPLSLNEIEKKIMHVIISFPNYNTDEISNLLTINSQDLQSHLTILELKGAIKLLFGKKIKILNYM